MAIINHNSISGINTISVGSSIVIGDNFVLNTNGIENVNGLNISGVVTASSFVGDGSSLTGIDATALKDPDGNVIIQAEASGINVTGVSTFSDEVYFGASAKATSGGGNFTLEGNIGNSAGTYLRGATVYIGANGGSGSYSNTVVVREASGNQLVELAYAGSTKLATTAGGIDVTGHAELDNVNIAGVLTATSAEFSGNVTVLGDLTYENVTNLDSVGVATARSGLRITGGGLDVVGVSTFNGDLSITDKIVHEGDTDTSIRFPSADTFTVETAGSERLRITSGGSVGIGTNSALVPVHIEVPGSGTSDAAAVVIKNASTSYGRSKLEFRSNNNFGKVTLVGGAEGTAAGNGSFDLEVWDNSGISNRYIRVDGESYSNYLAFWTGSAAVATNAERMRITNTGNIGIGTDNPTYKLHVVGTSKLDLSSSTTEGPFFINGNKAVSNGAIVHVRNDGVDGTHDVFGGIKFSSSPGYDFVLGKNSRYGTGYFQIRNQADTPLLTIGGTGDVGIGEDTPSCRLQVKDTATHTAYASQTPSITDCTIAVVNNPSSEAINNHATIQFNVNGGSYNRVCSISAVAESASSRATSLTFCTDDAGNRTEKLRISSDGDLLVGSTTGSARLQVTSGSREPFRFRSTTSGYNYLTHGHYSSGDLAYLGAGGGAAVTAGSNTDYAIRANQGSLIFATNGNSEKFRIGTSGQLGIAGANYGSSGQVLTSNGSGSAPSWQSAGGGPTTATASYTSVANVNTNNSWTNFPSLSASITTTTGKVMVHITVHIGTGNVAAVRMLQNGSVVGPTGSASGRTAAHAISNRGSDRTCPPLVLTFTHSPGTGTKSYQLQYRTQGNSWINSGSDSSSTDGNNFYTPASTITLVEVD